MATTYITRTPGSAGNRKTWTLSGWYKRSGHAADYFLSAGQWSVSQLSQIIFEGDDYLNVAFYSSGSVLEGHLETNRKFRDPAAWYHIVIAMDTTQSVAANRLKIYVNGVQETSFKTETYPAEDYEPSINNNVAQNIGRREGSGYFNGNMSHVQFVDGLALAPTEFGEVDSTSGIWKIKTTAYATPGTNGFFLKMEDRTNLDLDSSSNALTFTTSGTLTATYDNPSNNFCTANPLDNYYAGITYTNGNTTATSSTPYGYSRATLGVSAGLWYWEVKATTISAPDYVTGVASAMSTGATIYPGKNAGSWSYDATDGTSRNNGSGTAYGNTYSAGDIIGVYLDLTANKLYFAINGTVQNSGTGISITAPASTDDGVYAATAGVWTATTGTVSDFNFGNGYFGTTAVTSAVADEGGIGAFEYDPSAGTFDSASKDFRAVCTKNIKAYG